MGTAPKSIPKELLIKLLKLRGDMLISPKDSKHTLGKLAYDTLNGEFGFVIGPIELDRDKEEHSGKVKRALLVTLGIEGPRVRYSMVKNLKLYQDTEEGVDDLNSIIRSDVSEFCNNLCMHECSSFCILYKYKKK